MNFEDLFEMLAASPVLSVLLFPLYLIALILTPFYLSIVP
jgi:hypothetical protein